MIKDGGRLRRTVFLVTAIFLVSAGAVLTGGMSGAQADVERWYIVRVGGQDVGYVRETTSSKPGGRRAEDAVLESASEMKVVLNRLGAKVEMSVVTGSEETASGQLKRLGFDLKASALTMRTEAEIKDGAIEITSGTGGTSFARTLPFSGELLGPEGIRLRSRDGLRSPGDRVEYRTFEPSVGKIVTAVRVLVGREVLSLDGMDMPSLKVEETNDIQPVKRTYWLAEDGEVLKDEEPGPFGLMEVVRTDRAKALAAAAGGELPAEAYAQTLLKTGVRLPRPRDIEYLKLRLVQRRPELGWPEIPGARQKVVAKTAATLDLEVRRAGSVPSVALPGPNAVASRAYLEPNAYLQSNDPELRAQASAVVGNEKDAWRAALKLRRWTADHMTFDLGIAIAPSVEIFKNRRGTCVGYATMLATLTRAAGIPSRLVMGYAYVLGMFGGHAWTEVLIGGDWIALDAALPGAGAADAARFHLGESTLAEGAGALAISGQQVMGFIDLKVLAYRLEGGTTVEVPDGAAPFFVAGDVYRNPWLGLEVLKPSGFSFGRLDAVWPSTLLVEMKGPDGSRLELHEVPAAPWQEAETAGKDVLMRLGVEGEPRTETINGRAVIMMSGGAGAGAAIVEPGVVWAFTAKGSAAIRGLSVAVKSLVFSR
ncbi:MAG: transglutaminase domain-containing protein [Candidatus Aminicenantes bacterium]|nr:transglutaminase domain-containing protein [Candidatus Aminicenantes bacterium]